MENTIVFESTATFDVPVRIVDYYLKAPDVELRLILFLLRHRNSSFTKEDLCRALEADEERLDKAFRYWCAAGILFKAGNKYIAERPRLNASEIARYTADEIASRIEGDAELRFLYRHAEEALKKPLSASDASTIFSLVEWNGLPPEVAAMLIQYCTSLGKGLSRIQKMGIDWAEKGIDTYEKAEEYIRSEQEKASVISKTAARLGMTHRALTASEEVRFLAWNKEYGFGLDVVKKAYDRTVETTGKYALRYMDQILTRWAESGYHTVAEIDANDDGTHKKRQTRKRYQSAIDKKDLDRSRKEDWAILEAELNESDSKGEGTHE